jgi:hypothetical protein
MLASEYHICETGVSYSGAVENLGLLESDRHCDLGESFQVFHRVVFQMSKENYLTSEDHGITIL